MASQVEDIKWVPGTDFLVDGFSFKSARCSHYFLTHFHSDHTVGLSRGFSGGVIYCSHVTAKLLVHDMGLRPQVVRPLDVGAPVLISGVRVTPLDANHCPGSFMFLFEVPAGGKQGGQGSAGPATEIVPARDTAKASGGPGLGGGVASLAAAVSAAAAPGACWGGCGDAPTPPRTPTLGNGACGAAAGEQRASREAAAGELPAPGTAGRESGGGSGAAGGGGVLQGGSPRRTDRRDVLNAEDGEEAACGGSGGREGDDVIWVDSGSEDEGCGGVSGGGGGLRAALEPGASAPKPQPEPAAAGRQDCSAASVGGSGAGSGGGTVNILHTGDCRWQPWMRQQPGLAGVRVDVLFLDTTYAAPRHTLPPQSEAVRVMVQAMRDALHGEPRTVFLLAAYHIGKERAFLGAAQLLGAKVFCSAAKRAVLALLDLPRELTSLLVDDPRDALIHVTGWGLRPEDLQAYLDKYPGEWKQVVGIRPTGWTFRRSGGVSVRRLGAVALLGVPYSEHSSWTDLCDAVAQLRPRRLVPTVNAATPSQRRALVDRFAHLMDLSGDRSRLDVYLSRLPVGGYPGGGASSTAATRAVPALLPATPNSPSRCCMAAGSPPAAAAAAAAPGAARVDLSQVDLREQCRILELLQQQQRRKQDLQQQRRRRQQRGQQQQRQGQEEQQEVQERGGKQQSQQPGKRKAREGGEGWAADAAEKRQRQQLQELGGRRQQAAVTLVHGPPGQGCELWRGTGDEQGAEVGCGEGSQRGARGCSVEDPAAAMGGTGTGTGSRTAVRATAYLRGVAGELAAAAASAAAAAGPITAVARVNVKHDGRDVCVVDLTVDEDADDEGCCAAAAAGDSADVVQGRDPLVRGTAAAAAAAAAEEEAVVEARAVAGSQAADCNLRTGGSAVKQPAIRGAVSEAVGAVGTPDVADVRAGGQRGAPGQSSIRRFCTPVRRQAVVV